MEFRIIREYLVGCFYRESLVRYYDFARKCGNDIASMQEARILLSYGLDLLAYSILKTSNVDPQEELFLKIGIQHHVQIDVEEELGKFFKTTTG